MTGVPFALSLGRMREYLRTGRADASPRDAARTLIAGPDGRPDMLSVPVDGGRSVLKRRDADLHRIAISEHGRWRQEHLGAWNAAYGKTPFFIHLFPQVEEVYATASRSSLGEFNNALLSAALTFLDYQECSGLIEDAERENPSRLAEIRRELATKVNTELSIFDALFRLGKNTVFLL